MDTRKLSTSEGKGLSYCQILFVSKTGLNCEGWAQVLHTMAPNSSLWLLLALPSDLWCHFCLELHYVNFS